MWKQPYFASIAAPFQINILPKFNNEIDFNPVIQTMDFQWSVVSSGLVTC